MRLNLNQKMELIKQGKAYVAKADGSFFLYIRMNETDIVKKLTKKDWEELEYYQWEVNNNKGNNMWCIFNTKTEQTIKYFSSYEEAKEELTYLIVFKNMTDIGITLMD